MAVFGDLNKVEIIGNITQDIDLRYTANGTAVTNFSVATNRNYKVGEEWKDEATFHNVVVWSSDAEQISQRARKGTRIYVQGRLQTRSWDDQNGSKQYRTEIVAEKVILLDRYEKGSDDGGSYSAPSETTASKPQSSAPKAPKSTTSKPKTDDEDIIDPDDLPF